MSQLPYIGLQKGTQHLLNRHQRNRFQAVKIVHKILQISSLKPLKADNGCFTLPLLFVPFEATRAIAYDSLVLSTFVYPAILPTLMISANTYHISRQLDNLGASVDALASDIMSLSKHHEEYFKKMKSSLEEIQSGLEEIKGSMSQLENYLHEIDKSTRKIEGNLREMQGWMNGFAARQVDIERRHMSIAEKIITECGLKKDRPPRILKQV